VAPQQRVISDPIPQAAYSLPQPPFTGPAAPQQVEAISGPPGTRVEINVSGFNPLSVSGNLGIWTSV
jgi:hypothetical protein